MIKLSFFGGTKIVTGANYLLEIGKKKILIDCGLFQGKEEWVKKNYEPFPFSPKEIDTLILTHAHLDHIGRVPKLVREGFSGKIFATFATLDLAKLLLEDELSLQEEGISEVFQFFTKEDLKRTYKLFFPIDYHQEITLFEDKKTKVTFKLLDAGHILGSSIVEIYIYSDKDLKKIVFSGDLGNPPTPLLRPTEYPDGADWVVIESTYGDRVHRDFLKRKDILEDIIEESAKEKGVLLIPSFAVERTQELLFELNDLVENGKIPRVPVFLDSPLAIRSVEIYKRYEKYYNKEASYLLKSGDEIFKFPGLHFTKTPEESKRIEKVPPPKIIIAGSGMSTGGRILHHEKIYLPNPNTTLLFISYQAEGTRGREILEGKKEIEIFGEKVKVKAKIKVLYGYSAHADREALLRWVNHIKMANQKKEKGPIKKVFVVQGEEKPAQALCQAIKDFLGIEAEVPNYNSSYILPA